MEAKLDKPSVVHYVCDKKTTDFFSLWLNMELLMPVVIDCLVRFSTYVLNKKISSSPAI